MIELIEPTREQEQAIYEAHQNGCAEGFFSVRSAFFDTPVTRRLFNDAFKRGWDAAHEHINGEYV